jgi:hypothetical protein
MIGSRTTHTFSIIKQILKDHQSLLKKLGSGGVSARSFGQEGVQDATWVTFTKLIYIYHEEELSLQQRAELERFWNTLGLRTILRNPEYLATRPMQFPETQK